MTILCKNCKLFYGAESEIDVSFVKEDLDIANMVEMGMPRPPMGRLASEDGSFIPCCQYRGCFKHDFINSVVDGGHTERTRIASHITLNKNYDCKHFEPTLWFRIFG